MNTRLTIALTIGVAALALAGASMYFSPGEPEPPPPVIPDEARPEGLPLAAEGELPDLVLITIDTLRQDSLSLYGHERTTSPFIDAQAQRGTAFSHAWSTSSWTLPGLASTITGTWPMTHGALHGEAANRIVHSQEALHPDLPNLPETLQQMGYRTWGITANAHAGPQFGFARGFDRYTCLGFNIIENVQPVMEDWLPQLQEGPPFFLWLHLFDPHAPYDRREKFAEWAPNATKERKRPIRDVDLRRLKSEGKLTPELLEEAVAAYDSEIHVEDALIQQAYELLPRMENAFTIITSDHGEEFEDHGRFGHGQSLYDELTRVPLVVIDPKAEPGGMVDTPASVVDVFPTLVAAAGGTPPEGLAGIDLMDEPDGSRPIFIEVSRHFERRGVILGDWKLTIDPEGPPRPMLYDLSVDPNEQNNVARSHPDRVDELTRLIRAHETRWTRTSDAPVVEVDDDHMEALKAMGYVDEDEEAPEE